MPCSGRAPQVEVFAVAGSFGLAMSKAVLDAAAALSLPAQAADTGPAQKMMKLNKRGRTLKITAELLIQGSCGISRPFAPDSLRAYLDAGDDTKARRRLEADVKSLYALHEYGRLHHVQGEQTWDLYLVDQAGVPVHREEIQLARLAATVH